MNEKWITWIDHTPRLIRFCFVGGFCGLVQMAFLYVFVTRGVQENLSNLVAFIISVQINFFLSYFITWNDRRNPSLKLTKLARRLVFFNGMAITTMVVNQVAFAIFLFFTPYLVAGVLGILAAAAVNYMVSDKFIFAR